uniref:Uncharacterized protein n=1 Tax=Arundo donax TaxID=35708 RepID=A0A0A8Y7Z3_ARUDO
MSIPLFPISLAANALCPFLPQSLVNIFSPPLPEFVHTSPNQKEMKKIFAGRIY